MRIIEINVNGVELEVKTNQSLIAGSVGDVGCTFTFSPDWDPLTKVAVFTGGTESRSVMLDGSTVELPWETLQNEQVAYMIGVYGLDSGYLVRQTVPVLAGYVRCGSGDAQPAASPSPSLTQQLLEATQTAVRSAAAAAEQASILLRDGDGTRFLSDNGTYRMISGGGDGSGTVVPIDHPVIPTGKEITADTLLVIDPNASPNKIPQWYNGTAVTGTGTGISAVVTGSASGDYYVNTDNFNLYEATAANTWSFKGSIKGSQRFYGAEVTGDGYAAVPGSKKGDEYINTTTGDVYTASAANTWRLVTNVQEYRKPVTITFINTDDGVDGNISSDCTLIQTPTRNILVDIGRQSDYDTIKSALLGADADRLDYIFISHYHYDHCGCTASPTGTTAEESSLNTLFNDADIDTSACVLVLPHTPVFADLYAGEGSPAGVKQIYDIVQSVITDNGVVAQILANEHEGCYWDIEAAALGEVPVWSASKPTGGRTNIRVLNCSDSKFSNYYNASYNSDAVDGLGQYNAKTYNNYSTIIELEYGYTLCTLTGDINYTAEAVNAADMRQTDLLKIGHHSGNSEYAESFYRRTNPRYAIFNVDADVYTMYASAIIAERPAIAWLASQKTPMYFLSESGTMVWQSDGTKYELLTNNRSQHPEGRGAALLWSGSAAPGSTIDMTGTGWKDYTLYKVLLAANGTGIIATRVTTSSGEYFRGIGGSTNGTAPMYQISASFAATVSGDEITVFGTTNESHTTSSPYHSVTANPNIIAIYGIV